MSSTTTSSGSDPIYWLNSYFIHGTDINGKERYYRIRLFEETTDSSGKKTEKEISLTIDQWQQQSKLLETTLEPFLANTTISVPSRFDVIINDENIKLSSEADPRLNGFSLFNNSPEKVKTACDLFRSNIKEKKYSTELLIVPDLPEDLKIAELKPDSTKAPIGIRNMTGSDCFISAFLQAFVLDDEDLIEALWEEAEKTKKTNEFIIFLDKYLKAQKRGDANVGGVDQLRPSIARSKGTSTSYLRGPHDSTEALSFIFESISKNPIEQEGTLKGYIKVMPEDTKTLEELMLSSIKETNPHSREEPKHLMIFNSLNLKQKSFDKVTGELTVGGQTCELTSFIQHRSSGTGHYVAYVRKHGTIPGEFNYYECNDSNVTSINKENFLEAAKTAYVARYTRTP